ncbi:hypothetical protein EVG20_g7376 [Dentipellis fragilis]|uniref:AB hydrolase-1 domain-containing protein n=1 Tax=Dentipellis fragilis TaxID=205917 RepID=A0A4Y9YFD3_9AGAM|nr:hypothetical protein EVG20_g7376 [Dentipellis fragilis]
MSESTGFIEFSYQGECHLTWYKLIGTISPTSSRPLVVLHGGPGLSHTYLSPHARLHEQLGIPIIFYDQLGCGGRSTHLADKSPSFWTIDLFLAELDNVLAHFGIADDFDLLGHAWGGVLAVEYAMSRSPGRLKHLVIADTPASMKLWKEALQMLLQGLLMETGATWRKEEEDATASGDCREILRQFYQRHVCRLEPWPPSLTESVNAMEKDSTVRRSLLGPSQFAIDGGLKTWSAIDRLHSISCPLLVLNGRHDTVQDECVQPFADKVKKVDWVRFEESSHTPFFEEEEKYYSVVEGFLRQ